MRIRNMKDALEFAASFEDGDTWIFPDSTISMANSGATEIRKRNGEFYQFSFGQNWLDQQEEFITDIGKCIWEHRADIRRGEWLRRNE